MKEQHGFTITVEIVNHADSYEEAFKAAVAAADDLSETLDSAYVVVAETGKSLLSGPTGVFCEGCDGHVFEGIRWPTSCNDDSTREWVERCDRCERYESDEAAALALREIYGENVAEFGEAKPVGLNSLHPYLSTD